jgi:hypothetical protein
MDYFVAAVLLTIIIGGFVLVSKSDSNESNEQYKSPLQQKQEDYTAALTALRADPTNPALHEQALLLGRIYAAATRTNKAVTLFDETALANDIRAVTANATQTTVPVAALNSATAPANSLDERINALLKMKASGLITDAEFDHKRKELLDSI